MVSSISSASSSSLESLAKKERKDNSTQSKPTQVVDNIVHKVKHAFGKEEATEENRQTPGAWNTAGNNVPHTGANAAHHNKGPGTGVTGVAGAAAGGYKGAADPRNPGAHTAHQGDYKAAHNVRGNDIASQHDGVMTNVARAADTNDHHIGGAHNTGTFGTNDHNRAQLAANTAGGAFGTNDYTRANVAPNTAGPVGASDRLNREYSPAGHNLHDTGIATHNSNDRHGGAVANAAGNVGAKVGEAKHAVNKAMGHDQSHDLQQTQYDFGTVQNRTGVQQQPLAGVQQQQMGLGKQDPSFGNTALNNEHSIGNTRRTDAYGGSSF